MNQDYSLSGSRIKFVEEQLLSPSNDIKAILVPSKREDSPSSRVIKVSGKEFF